MDTIGNPPEDRNALNRLVVPDLWQQQAVAALREGRDVVVQAPTGSGKTLIFEQWSHQGKPKGRAIYTVPTRALANDKLAEWRARGWNVGIATGDLSENLDAPIIVATLETQKARLIRGEGPDLLVVDEYQMIADRDRGLNYELAMAMAPDSTQFLLLSGSVGNPHSMVKWLERLGRRATLIRHEERPVPLEEVHANRLNFRVPSEIRGYWPQLVAKCLADDLGPILIFAPRRQAAETLAAELARQLPNPNPLDLSAEQRLVVGPHLARMLSERVAYHHSGLSYAARAGVVEPLAKSGALRVVVATMGLAAGINFSLRSVALAGDSYRRDGIEQPLRGDEVLQMWGRAGRRGIDEIGFVLVSANQLALKDGYACEISRNGMVDWGALLGVMQSAVETGRPPFPQAVRVQERLFTTKPIFLGIENALKNPGAPCGLETDAERARHVRRQVREFRNSRGEWEPWPATREIPLGRIQIQEDPEGEPRLRPLLTEAAPLERLGPGRLTVLEDSPDGPIHGRRVTVADRLNDDRLVLAKWIRRLTHWKGRQVTHPTWENQVVPLMKRRLEEKGLPLVRLEEGEMRVAAILSLALQTVWVPVDRHGVALYQPPTREVAPPDCAVCELTKVCRNLSTATGEALLWRRLGLVEPDGTPTRRGRIVSFFSQGDGLAVAVALEVKDYPIGELVYDLANLDAGFRFCGEGHRYAGRLATASQAAYGNVNIPGYLENGVPPRYGHGAEEVVAAAHANPLAKQAWVTEILGPGDIDRIIIEWRSRLRQITHAPSLDWDRWGELQVKAENLLQETQSPTATELPALGYSQQRRVDHRLRLNRY